ncbi:MAG: hypothetical protein Q8L81_11640 [Bacteroidota bacterium]|nr:hypothetical protein [Bacteroidota bacterium]
MRQFLSILLLALIALPVFSQVPTTINYQGIARDASGNPVANQTIGLQFKISNPANTSFHSETQSVTTNSLGLFSTKIGAVTPLPTTGWNSMPCILDVSIDVNSSGFVSLGSQTLASVPYALYTLNSGALPTATLNGTTLKYNAGTSQWQIDTLLLNNGSRVSVGKRNVVQNNKFKSVADNVSDSAAIFGLHTSATDGYAGVRGFASGSSLPSSTLNATGIAGGHFVGFNLLGQGIGALGQGISNSGNGIGVVGIGSSNGISIGSNYAIGLYGSVDLNSTAVNKYAGVFDNGGVIIRDSLILGPGTNVGVAGDVLTRSSTGRARWQAPGAVAAGPFTSSANYIHAAPSFTNNRIVFGLAYPTLGFPFQSRFTVVNGSANSSDTAVIISQLNSTRPALYAEVKGLGYAISALQGNTALGSYAGFFDGGVIIKGKNTLNNAYGLIVKDLSSANLFAVRNDGKVGVGTLSPAETVQIESNTGMSDLSIISNSISSIALGTPTLHNRGVIRYNHASNTMDIWTNNTPNRIFIDPSGYIGLKTNNTSGHDLNIFNPGNNTSIKFTNNFTSNLGLVIGQSNTVSYLASYENTPFNFVNNTTTFMTAQPNGNVGIGLGNVPSVNSRLAIKDGHFQTQQTVGPTIIGNNNAVATFWNGNSTDVAGIIEIQINASPLPGVQATVTFNKTYNSAPIVVITPMNNFYGAKAVALSDVFVTTSPSGFTINFNTAYPIPISTMYFNYIVIEGN